MSVQVTVLNPGQMGTSVAAAAVAGGATVRWVSEGRGAATRQRAEQHGLTESPTLKAAIAESDLVLSVCPPHAALDVAQSVEALGFDGLFVDCNAVSPGTANRIASVFAGTSVRLVDGGIIGPPAWKAGTTRLYLSGDGAAEAGRVFEGTLLDARVIGSEIGAASALKMAYAAWTKGSDALLLGVRALASAQGVNDALLDEWRISQTTLPGRSESAAAKNSFKAWRFEGEMHEIADTFRDAGLPEGFHRAAADVYHRMSGYKDATEAPGVDDVAKAIIDGTKST